MKATLVLFMAVSLHAAEEAPAWLKQLASVSHPSYPSKVPAVVLLNEAHTTVDANGRLTVRTRKAIKILTREGAREARAAEIYLTKTGKVREMQGWLIRPSGEVKRYAKDKVVDLAMRDEDVYNEVRLKVISAASDSEPGATFGFEVETEDKSVFTQFQWDFQDDLPALVSRQLLSLAPGWEARSVILNHDDVKPKLEGGVYSWELTGLPFVEQETARPPVSALAPRVAITLLPPSGSSSRMIGSWADVSKWMSELHDPQAASNEALTAKAQALTASAVSEFDKIRALAEFAQNINYVSIQTGLGRGGGYQPHPAAEAFAKSYGDCKDKANLMRTMLKAIGIESYPVSIFSGDRSYVRKEWPSPQQFNHAIIAIRVSGATQSPAITSHPSLGRLLIFDPTDPYTMLGDLPVDEQGSFALVSSGADGALIQMPVLPAEASLRERRTEMQLGIDGSVQVSIGESSRGQAARNDRSVYRRLSPPDFRAMNDRWIAAGAPGAPIKKLTATDRPAEGRFDMEVELAAASYARAMRDRLLIFKPCVLPRHDALVLAAAKRQHPVVLDPQAFRETIRVAIPAGFVVDEMIEPLSVKTDFGSFEASGKVDQGKLIVERRLELKASTLPASRYEEVRQFLNTVNGWEQSSIVLARK